MNPGKETGTVRRRRTAPAAAAGGPVIALAGVEKIYRTGRVESRALAGVDLAVAAGEMVAIVGPSGSGKTTIINLIAGIDLPTTGTVTVNGSRLDQMNEEQLAVWRGRNIGIVFQFFQLLPTLTAAENAQLPLDLARIGRGPERAARARRDLAAVGLGELGDRLPLELSGGQQQRAAIARAMACQPRILLGDEPTGNLDSGSARVMFGLLRSLNETGTTVLYVTHDQGMAAMASRVVTVSDGRIVDDTMPVSRAGRLP